MPPKLKPVISAVLIAAVVAVVVWVSVWGTSTGAAPESPGSPEESVIAEVVPPELPSSETDPAEPAEPALDAPAADDGAAQIAELFRTERTEVQVRGSGRVSRVLSDDNEGDRHQRFILELSNGMTILVAHNIDDFPRLDGLAVGDEVAFNGEYVWGEEGGTIHWTHRDHNGDHADGWLEWKGKRYW